jgi:hypothetical protein
MLGIALANRIPVLSVVGDAVGKEELKNFGAENVLVQESMTFQNDIAELTQRLETTAVLTVLGLNLSIGLFHHSRLTRQFIPMAVWARRVSSVSMAVS